VIIGSTRDGRFGPVAADWTAGHIAQREDVTADLIDLVARLSQRAARR
jgi:NAD(P)H-dependent FMN reductase